MVTLLREILKSDVVLHFDSSYLEHPKHLELV